MESPSVQPAMSRQIFKMGLSTEAISLYLLCCHLQDAQTEISRNNIADLWNGSAEALAEGIEHLKKRRILSRFADAGRDGTVYQLNEDKDWQI
jgi:hypothetical protein